MNETPTVWHQRYDTMTGMFMLALAHLQCGSGG